MSKKKRKRNLLITLIIILILVALGLYFFLFMNNQNNSKVIDIVESYNYTLESRDTQLMKENFNELKNILSDSQIDFEKYASTLSKLFIIDLYTINNKNNKYDVGSVEYIYPDNQENFKLNVQDTIYKYVSYKDVKLPEVKEINVSSIKETTFNYLDKEYTAYNVSLNWSYVKDFGYDESGEITIFKDANTLYVGQYVGKEVNEKIN